MYLIRDVFRCTPGRSREVAEKFKKSLQAAGNGNGLAKTRIMIDYIADYWTVVLEQEVEDLQTFERHMAEVRENPRVREAMAGYMEMVDRGHREIFRIV
jgi:hypothetical protein